MRNPTDKQVNFAIDQEMYDQVKASASARGVSLTAFLRDALSKATLDDMKNAVPDQASNMDIFTAKLGELTSCYKAALDQAANAYSIASSQVKEELKGLQDLTRMTQEQSDTISKLRDDNEKLRSDLSAVKQSIEDQEALKDEIKKLSDENLDLKKKIAEMNEAWANEKLAHADEIQKLQSENFDKLLQVIKAKSE